MHNLLKRLGFLSVSSFLFLAGAWADDPAVPAGAVAGAGTTAAAQQPSMFGSMFPLILMFGVVYLLILRPQQKKMREQQQMLGTLKHGDEVLTASGILGTITGITDKVVTVEVADNVRVKMLKSQVSQVIKGNIKDLPA
jgi:preprotein translocase subunit YajC